jgi:hypothetical protein
MLAIAFVVAIAAIGAFERRDLLEAWARLR